MAISIASTAPWVRADLRAVRAAAVPVAEAKARLRQQLDSLAERGAVNPVGLLEAAGGSLRWPLVAVRSALYGHAEPGADGGGIASLAGFAATETVDTAAVFAWLHYDALYTRLAADLDAMADDDAALGGDHRLAQESTLLAALLDAERREETLLSLAEEQGQQVARRPDADPRAILGVQ